MNGKANAESQRTQSTRRVLPGILKDGSSRVYHSFHSVYQLWNVEVYQQAYGLSGQAEVCQQLLLMNRECLFNSLDFNDNLIGHQHIHFVSRSQADAMVHQRYPHVSLNLEAKCFQVMTQAGLVGALKKSRPERGVDVYCSADDLAGQISQWKVFHGTLLLRVRLPTTA